MGSETRFIKLYAKLLDSGIADDAITLGIFTRLLLDANYTTKKKRFGKDWVKLTPGQLKISIKQYANCLNISQYQLRGRLKRLQQNNTIEQKTSTCSGTIITIENWKDYQGDYGYELENKTKTKQKQNKNETKTKQKPTKNEQKTISNSEIISTSYAPLRIEDKKDKEDKEDKEDKRKENYLVSFSDGLENNQTDEESKSFHSLGESEQKNTTEVEFDKQKIINLPLEKNLNTSTLKNIELPINGVLEVIPEINKNNAVVLKNTDEKKKRVLKKTATDEDYALSKKWAEYTSENWPNIKADIDKWAEAIAKIKRVVDVREDGKIIKMTHRHVEGILHFIQKDSFWKNFPQKPTTLLSKSRNNDLRRIDNIITSIKKTHGQTENVLNYARAVDRGEIKPIDEEFAF